MTERAQQIMKAYKANATIFPTTGVAAAIRAMGDSFVYDDNGIAWFTADDFKKLADDVEAL